MDASDVAENVEIQPLAVVIVLWSVGGRNYERQNFNQAIGPCVTNHAALDQILSLKHPIYFLSRIVLLYATNMQNPVFKFLELRIRINHLPMPAKPQCHPKSSKPSS
jgi:hypothetical protein